MKIHFFIALAVLLSINAEVSAQDVASDAGKGVKEKSHAPAEVAKETTHRTTTAVEKISSATEHGIKETGRVFKKGVKGVGHRMNQDLTQLGDAPK
jgi:hypothetical protein